MTNFKIFLFIFLHFVVIHAKISDYRKCANKDCSEPVSLARSLLNYVSDDSRILSFRANMPIKIFSKEAGTRLDLWGAEINGKRGYVPLKMIREIKILNPNLDHLVLTEGEDDPALKTATVPTGKPNSEPVTLAPEEVQDKISPNTVTPSYEVIDGTTILSPPDDNSSPDYSSTPSSVDSSKVQHSEIFSHETKTETLDTKLVNDNLAEKSEIKVQVEENTVSKEESSEDDADYDGEDEEENTEDEDDDENEENEVETSTEVLKSTEIPTKTSEEQNISASAVETVESSSVKANENNPATVISSPIQNIVDHNDSKPVDPKTAQVDPVTKSSQTVAEPISESKEEEKQIVAEGNANVIEEKQKTDEINANIGEEKQKTEEINAQKTEEINAQKTAEINVNTTEEEQKTEEISSNITEVKQKTAEINANITEEEQKTEDISANIIEEKQKTDEINANMGEEKQKTEEINAQKTAEINMNTTEEEQKTEEISSNITEVKQKTAEINANITEEEQKTEDISANIIEEKQKTPEINMVPSDFFNPLNLFHKPVPEEKDEPKNEAPQIQVPENLLTINNTQPSPLPVVEEVIPTTQASVDEFIPPINDYKDAFTENPIKNDPYLQPLVEKVETIEVSTGQQPETKAEIINEVKVEQGETKTEHNKQESVENIIETSSEIEITPKVSEEKIAEINYDKAEEPTFIDAVGSKYNSLVSEEIPQNNDLDQNIENVSFEPVTEKLISEQTIEQSAIVEETTENVDQNEEPGFFSRIFSSLFSSADEQVAPTEEIIEENIKYSEIIEVVNEKSAEQTNSVFESMWGSHAQEKPVEKYLPPETEPEVPNQSDMQQSCASIENPALCGLKNEYIKSEIIPEDFSWPFDVPENAYSIFLYLSLTALTVLLFSLGFYYIEKRRKDGTLISSINSLEKKLLISSKECLLLQDELTTTKERLVSIENSSFGSDEMVTSLKEEIEMARATRSELEEQISNLEKELENATEAGMELNIMLREILTSQSGNEHLIQNVEQLQKQLNEQQETINNMKAILSAKNMENELLQTELSVANEKNVQLQDELDKMVVNLLSAQEEKNIIENKLEEQNEKLKSENETTIKQINTELNVLKDENKKLKQKIEDTQRILDLKSNEYDLLKQGMKEIQGIQSNKDSIMALLDVSHVKAEVQQLRDEKHKMAERIQKEIDEKSVFEKEVQVMIQEVKILKDKFDEAEKEKVEAQTRLEVLSAYFKEKETQLQKEINENESKFTQKEGEATSTIERIKWIQEELQNYKAQNELLKKEILDQEVSLKSQISMLEKKSHDNWVNARQVERRLEESKQEASQLRNRLTIVEKNFNNSHMADESKLSNRIMSPLESNGELPVSPLHMSQVDASSSPPLLFPHRDHLTTSPPIPGLPPFMPPPPGVPFMPHPLPGVPPFMPPPPSLFPGDHRPPPLGRMSSPPLHGRYSPDSRTYSPYDRDVSPPLSPSYPDSDYRRRSPPPPSSHMSRTYSPYSGKSARPPPHWELDEERDRDYRGPPHRNKPRTHKGLSSGSGNSNESLDNSGRHSGRV